MQLLETYGQRRYHETGYKRIFAGYDGLVFSLRGEIDDPKAYLDESGYSIEYMITVIEEGHWFRVIKT